MPGNSVTFEFADPIQGLTRIWADGRGPDQRQDLFQLPFGDIDVLQRVDGAYEVRNVHIALNCRAGGMQQDRR